MGCCGSRENEQIKVRRNSKKEGEEKITNIFLTTSNEEIINENEEEYIITVTNESNLNDEYLDSQQDEGEIEFEYEDDKKIFQVLKDVNNEGFPHRKAQEIYDSFNELLEDEGWEEEINTNDLKIYKRNSSKFGIDITVCKAKLILPLTIPLVYILDIFHNIQNRSHWDKSISQINFISGTFLDDCMIKLIRHFDNNECLYIERHITRKYNKSVITIFFTPEEILSSSEEFGILLLGIFCVIRDEFSYSVVFIHQFDEKGPIKAISHKNSILSFKRSISRLKKLANLSTI